MKLARCLVVLVIVYEALARSFGLPGVYKVFSGVVEELSIVFLVLSFIVALVTLVSACVNLLRVLQMEEESSEKEETERLWNKVLFSVFLVLLSLLAHSCLELLI